MTSKLLRGAALASLLLAGRASAATLTITPDRSTYQVGETIVLSVVGDAEGRSDNSIFGQLLFDADRADYVASTQVGLTSFGGAFPWIAPGLSGGVGFAEAFKQFSGGTAQVPDEPLRATVSLRATGPGTLIFQWNLEASADGLDFFGLTNAPGGSVTIVPEPATGLLLAFGLLAVGRTNRQSLARRRVRP